MKLTILKGLPASGKTVFALEQVKKSNGNTKRVNKDEIRGMIDGGQYSKSNENFIRKVESAIILEALDNGHNVIVDSTNLDPSNEKRIRELVEKFVKMKWKDVDIVVKEFDVSVEECIERDSKREKPVGEKVIREMHERYGKKTEELPQWIKGNPRAIIVDLDGTLAIHVNRSPYDAAKCETDEVSEQVLNSVVMHKALGDKIILCSGREDKYRLETVRWLEKNFVPYDDLLMRREGDKRNDAIVKEELYNESIRGVYNVFLVYDDRDRVVDMWRKKGLKCFQVANGNF